MRQCPDRYAIRAGQNLPGKEFRYLRTVIVTAAVYWGLSSVLRLLLHFPLTFQHRAGVSPYTSPFGFAETCVFDKQSPGPFHCGLHCWRHPFSRSYGVNMPSSLTTLLPLALGFSPHLPVSVCGTGAPDIPHTFSRRHVLLLPYLNFSPLRPGQPAPGSEFHVVSVCLNLQRLRNFYRMCIDYALRPRLSSRLTQGGRTCPWKP